MTWWALLLVATIGPALVQKTLGRGLTEVCVTILRGLSSLCDAMRGWSAGKREALSGVLDAESLRYEGRWRWSYAIGSTIVAATFAVFLVLEWETLTVTLAALGWLQRPVSLGIDIGLLVGLSVIGPFLVCLWLLVELWGHSRFLPAQVHGRGEKIFWSVLCGAACALSLSAVPVTGLFRLEAERQNTALERLEMQALASSQLPGASRDVALLPAALAEPEGEKWRDPASVVSIVLIPLAVTCASAAAWHFGASVVFLQLLPAGILALLCVALRPIEWVIQALRGLISLLYVVLRHGLNGLSKIGTILVRPLLTMARASMDWAQEALRPEERESLPPSKRALAILALALTSWSRDVEIPDEPEGEQAGIEETLAQEEATSQAEPATEHTPFAQPEADAAGNPAQPQGFGFGEEADANWDPYRR